MGPEIGTVATVSRLISAAVGGGTLAGSGRGTAASIASSAAELRGASFCAKAELAAGEAVEGHLPGGLGKGEIIGQAQEGHCEAGGGNTHTTEAHILTY